MFMERETEREGPTKGGLRRWQTMEKREQHMFCISQTLKAGVSWQAVGKLSFQALPCLQEAKFTLTNTVLKTNKLGLVQESSG